MFTLRRRVNSYAFLSPRGVSLRTVLSAQDAPLPVDLGHVRIRPLAQINLSGRAEFHVRMPDVRAFRRWHS